MRNVNFKEVDKLFNDAIQVLRTLVNCKMESPMTGYDHERVKVASTFVGNYPRIIMAQASANQIAYDILKELLKNDKDKLQELAKTALPFPYVLSALPGIVDQDQKTVEGMQNKLKETIAKYAAQIEDLKKERDELRFELMQHKEKDNLR